MASLTDLIVSSQKLMRDYAFHQLCSGGLTKPQAKLSSRSSVSQRDIQRVFTLYQCVVEYIKIFCLFTAHLGRWCSAQDPHGLSHSLQSSIVREVREQALKLRVT